MDTWMFSAVAKFYSYWNTTVRSIHKQELASFRSRVPESNQLSAGAYGSSLKSRTGRMAPREVYPGRPALGYETINATKRHGLGKPAAVRTIEIAIGHMRGRCPPRSTPTPRPRPTPPPH